MREEYLFYYQEKRKHIYIYIITGVRLHTRKIIEDFQKEIISTYGKQETGVRVLQQSLERENGRNSPRNAEEKESEDVIINSEH